MIVALCSTGMDLLSKVDERFGRAEYFLIFNTENSAFTAVKNEAITAKGGAGALAVQQLVDHKVEIVIAPEVGPQALDALKKFRISAYKQGDAETAQEALTAWQNKELTIIQDPGSKGLHKA